ncbi:MAG: SWIM zinc finger family protein [Polyangiaceae bacterium]
MSALALEHRYQYLRASQLGGDHHLRLATVSPGDLHPHFFTGRLANPERTAKLLLSLMSVVHARFHIPAAMLERILAQSDPVVTSSDDRLRFEGFSGCCGAYARVDLHPEALEGERFGRGTTNVDFNQPMLSALAGVRGAQPVSISVGQDSVELSTEAVSVVERKVKLPMRWLRGFVEVQAVAQRMRPVLEVNGVEAARFLKGLPRMHTNRRSTWIVPSGRSLRLSQVEPKGAARDTSVRVGGLERLRCLEKLASSSKALRIFSDARTGATGWVLVFDDSRFQLLISPEVWRGFSGEGQALEALAGEAYRDVLNRVRAQLSWNAVIEPKALAERAGVPLKVVADSLAALGTRGLVGFDLDAGAYFHRELPFDLSLVERTQSRLKAARKLASEGKVRIEQRKAGNAEAYVASAGVEHHVRLTEDDARCSCPWYAKHQTERGPCKHLLALQIVLEDTEGE